MDKRRITEAEILQASAVAVAAPRYMGAFAAAIGVSVIDKWPWFATVEIVSGLAMALLEGWAIAYTFRRWRTTPIRSFHWYALMVIQLFLLAALPSTVTPYLVSAQLHRPVADIFGLSALLWGWSFLVAAVAPLIVAAVGYSDVDTSHVTTTSHEPDKQDTDVPHEPDRTPAPVPLDIVEPEPVLVAVPLPAGDDDLTERQRQIWQMTEAGMSIADIADRLKVSTKTVSRDREKLNGRIK